MCPRRQRVAQLVIFFTASQIYGLSQGPSELLHTLILIPGQYTIYIQHTTLLKATTVTKEGSILLVLIYDLETHLPN